MRSAIVAAAFAAGTLAVPLMERDVVYETDIVYETAYVTVTAGEAAQTEAPAPSSAAPVKQNNGHYGHRKPKSSSVQQAEGYGWTSSWATTWTESAPAATSVQEQAPAYTSAATYTSVEEQAPASSTYEAPQSSTESTPTSSEAPPATSSATSTGPLTNYQDIVLHHHNIHRANHSAPAVEWNSTLADIAEQIGQSCSYEHNTAISGGGFGQNIAAGVKGDNVSAVITELFYNGEINAYGDNYGRTSKSSPAFDDSLFHEWGHMTQIVWVGTTSVGCATVDCSASGLANTGGNVAPYFTVCNYYGAGNMVDAYDENVLRPRGDATCYWDDGL